MGKYSLVLWSVIFVFVVSFLGHSYIKSNEFGTNVLLQLPEEERQDVGLPLRFSTGESSVSYVVLFDIEWQSNEPTEFGIFADDCLEQLRINGTNVEVEGISFCDFSSAHTFDLSAYLASGKNTIEAHVRNNGGDTMFDFLPVNNDSFTYFVLLLGTALIFLLYLLHYFHVKKWIYGVALILFCSIGLRLYYTAITPHWIRGHDTEGHIEYIQYLLERRALPPPDLGWETWQPPLYYLISAVLVAPLHSLGAENEVVNSVVQIVSMIMNIASILILVLIGRILIPAKYRPEYLWMFLAVVSIVPGYVYYAARINNDVLAALIGFIALGLLMHWWQKERLTTFVLLSFTIGLSLLSKGTGLLLVPIVLTCVILRRAISWKRKIALCLLSLCIVAGVAGWFSVYRYSQNKDQHAIIGNEQSLNSELAVPNSLSAFTVFNPVAMFHHPYNNPWNDEERRQYFWEYVYRSAFFGEFEFDDDLLIIASWIIAFSFIPFLVTLYGIVTALRKDFYQSIPLLCAGAAFLLGHLVFRIRFPFSASQDFRYSVLILIPMAYFLVYGLWNISNDAIRRTVMVGIGFFMLLCTIFLLNIT